MKLTGKKALALALCGSVVVLSQAKDKRKKHRMIEKPNIIYILADDLGYGDLSCYGQTKFQTPNLDAMASQGMRFTSHYSGCTVSAPSRCSLMTGLHTGHTPIRGNGNHKIGDEIYDTPLPGKYTTIAECLKEQNYTTACVGKWGMGGPGTEGHPNSQGFDYFYGYLGQGHAHYSYPKFLFENTERLTINSNPSQKQHYAQDLIMEKAEKFINENKDNPFFLYLSVTIPHAELITPDAELEAFKGRYPEKPWLAGQHYGGEHNGQPWPHAAFATMVTRLDSDIGRIRALLSQLGIDKNTLILFTSDNGPHVEGGADPVFFNSGGGYRGVKRDLYEAGVRVPMIAYWSGVIKSGSVCSQPSAFWDVLPTLCDISGAAVPTELDGLSFYGDLKGKERKNHPYFYWEFHESPSQSVREGKWKAIRKNVNTTPVVELYDLSIDPGEANNIADANPDMVAHMVEIMKNARTNDTQWKFKN